MTPKTPTGFVVGSFAARLINPRSLYVLPNGDVLTAEATGRNGTAGQITLLRDADGNGIAETRTVFLSGLHQPFGMLLLGDTFYVAATAAVWQFAYRSEEHTSELQSLMRRSYAVFCLKKNRIYENTKQS